MSAPSLGRAHLRRLREVWRSAGWPFQDVMEAELLAAGLLERLRDGNGRETLRVTDAGVQALAASAQRNRRAFDAHESLVECVAREMQRAGRIVWRGLSLRAPVAGEDGTTRWAMAMPDVFSIRPSPVDDYVEPVVHEIKVSRADLLAELRKPDKQAAYLGISSQCWLVYPSGLAHCDEIPPTFGVLEAQADGSLACARSAPRRPMRLPTAAWVALARATALPPDDEPAQRSLAERE
jgi:hypothetical protein